MQSLDVTLELLSIHTPDTPPADLYCREAAASNQRINLRNAHAQVGGDVFESQKARFHPRTGGTALGLGGCHEREFSTEPRQQPVFEPVCFFLSDDGSTRAGP